MLEKRGVGIFNGQENKQNPPHIIQAASRAEGPFNMLPGEGVPCNYRVLEVVLGRRRSAVPVSAALSAASGVSRMTRGIESGNSRSQDLLLEGNHYLARKSNEFAWLKC